MGTMTITEWQRRLFEQPNVFTVRVMGEDTGNLYETAEAADIEAQWRRQRGEKATVVRLGNLHTLELSRERWEA